MNTATIRPTPHSRALALPLILPLLGLLLGGGHAAAAPLNDLFFDAEIISGASGGAAGSTVDATKEPGEPDHGGNFGGASIWYRWQATADGLAIFDTFTSNFDTLLAAYTGDSVDALLLLAGNDDSGGLQSRISFPVQTGVIYSIAVDGYNGVVGNVALHWITMAPPPNDKFELAQPLNGNDGTAGGSTAGASKDPGEPNHAGNPGGASVWFVWQPTAAGIAVVTVPGSAFDTLMAAYTGPDVASLTLLAGNDDSQLSLRSTVVFPVEPGVTYYVALDGYNGASGDYQLAWSIGNPPPNDNFEDATLLAGSFGSVNGETFRASKEAGEPAHAGNFGGHSLWYRWVSPVTGPASFDTLGSGFDTLLAAYVGSTVDALLLVAQNDDIDFGGGIYQSRIAFAATEGQEYWIAVDGYAGDVGLITLSWVAGAPPNDQFADAYELTGNCGQTNGVTIFATKELGEPNHGGNPGSASVWFKWTALADGPAGFSTYGSVFDTLLAAYTGDDVALLTLVAENDDSASLLSRILFTATAGTTYYIALDGYNGAAGAYRLSWGAGIPANDAFADAQLLPGLSGSVTGCNFHATLEPAEPLHAGVPGGHSVWYRLTPGVAGVATLRTPGSALDTVLAAYTGASVDALTLRAENDDFGGTLQSQIQFAVQGEETCFIAMDGYAGTEAAFRLAYEFAPLPQLHINRVGPNVVIDWSGPYRLESADVLANGGATVWTAVPGASPVTLPADAPQRFFRATFP